MAVKFHLTSERGQTSVLTMILQRVKAKRVLRKGHLFFPSLRCYLMGQWLPQAYVLGQSAGENPQTCISKNVLVLKNTSSTGC